MTVPDTSTPAVILRLYDHQGLGVIRSLGRMGIPVYGIDPDPWSPGLKSRYCRDKFIWNVDESSPEENVDLLLRAGKKIGRRSVLISFSDEMAVMIADHAEALKEWFIFHAPSPAVVRNLVSKKSLFFLAKQEGVPTAETLFPESRDDVVNALGTVRFPVMLKGIDGGVLHARTGKKMVVVRTAEELLRLYDRMEDPGNPNLMLQDYIPGGEDSVWMFNGYFNGDSECLAGFTGKKIRQAPIHTGATSLGICLQNDVVENTTKEFMKRLGYSGILDIGYRYDARDGTYKVLDVNPRIGATFRLFVGDNGMDVARAAYLDLTGQAVPASKIRPGRKWFVEDRDLISSCRYYREKNLSFMQWVRSFRGVEEAAYCAGDDLMPLCVMIWKFTQKVLKKRNIPLSEQHR